MKYGSQLSGRSVPEWQAHNILYGDLKQEIKDATSKQKFDRAKFDTVATSLADELSNVSLFVRSKLGEVDYRIHGCSKISDEYLLRLEISHLNTDIQRLARFIGAQYTGFRKLIKKYRRHAPPDTPPECLLDDIERLLETPDSFAQVDLTPRYVQLAVLYNALRGGTTIQDAPRITQDHNLTSPASQLMQFDIAMLCVSNVERFWVHPENLVELKVLLLKNMTLVHEVSEDEKSAVEYMDTPELEYARLLREPAQIRQVFIGRDASKPILCAPRSGIRPVCTIELTPQLLELVRSGSLTSESLQNQDMDGQLALGWALTRNALPSWTLNCRMSRFKSVDSQDSATRAWAELKCDIPEFPYAVLEIRAQGNAPWLEDLRKSHLVFPVSQSFSLYAWGLMKKGLLDARPRWLDSLVTNEEIRRLPTAKPKTLQPKPSHPNFMNSRNEETQNTGPRYWNEFDDGDDEEYNGLFIDAEDEELAREQRASNITKPIFAFRRGVLQGLQGLRARLGSSSDHSGDSESSIGTSPSLQYSPRIRPQSPIVNPEPATNDGFLSVLTALCLSVSLTIVGLVYAILIMDGPENLLPGARWTLIAALIFALVSAAAGSAIFNLEAAPLWQAQILVHSVLFTVFCFGVGAVVSLILPPIDIPEAISFR